MSNPVEPAHSDLDPDPVPPTGAKRGGRPSGLTRDRVQQAIDELETATGLVPSVRALQERLGGGRTRLSQLREQVLTERLIDQATPADDATTRALGAAAAAALRALATEALRGADRAIEAAREEAARRSEAAERIRLQAERSVAAAALERERAIGQVQGLERMTSQAEQDRSDLVARLQAAQEREQELQSELSSLHVGLAKRESEFARSEAAHEARSVEDKRVVDTLRHEGRTLSDRLEEVQAQRVQEADARAALAGERQAMLDEHSAIAAAHATELAAARSELEQAIRDAEAARSAGADARTEKAALESACEEGLMHLSRTRATLERTRTELARSTAAGRALQEQLERERNRQDERDQSTAAMLAEQHATVRELIERLG